MFRRAVVENAIATNCPLLAEGFQYGTNRSDPTKLLQTDRIVPDLRHILDPISIEFHMIDVVRGNLVASWSYRSTGARLGSMENGESRYRVPGSVLGKKFEFVVAIRYGRK